MTFPIICGFWLTNEIKTKKKLLTKSGTCFLGYADSSRNALYAKQNSIPTNHDRSHSMETVQTYQRNSSESEPELEDFCVDQNGF